ncbi:hypothetical protein KI387_033604 [Taxus chinensis]|uniref:Peptidase A2 domain-containing protein n=1 Tax=Taxus chinensis TaxID=29808 RepID=A0AA38BV19_TAXCH|nr:hypothetical protein KI387_033604 [Taxus chinensis]
MVDSGASSTIMSKVIAQKLGLQYEPTERSILQLDGTATNTVGIIKNLEVTLHACPNVSILQDVTVVDLPPYFALCLSRDFTTKIGGYLSSDWSLFFTTHYGTKVTINSEPLARFHIEPHSSNAVANYSALDQSDFDEVAHVSALDGVSNMFMDEKTVEEHAHDPFKEVEEHLFGVYCMHEENTPLPLLSKIEDSAEGIWKLHFDGAKNKKG